MFKAGVRAVAVTVGGVVSMVTVMPLNHPTEILPNATAHCDQMVPIQQIITTRANSHE